MMHLAFKRLPSSWTFLNVWFASPPLSAQSTVPPSQALALAAPTKKNPHWKYLYLQACRNGKWISLQISPKCIKTYQTLIYSTITAWTSAPSSEHQSRDDESSCQGKNGKRQLWSETSTIRAQNNPTMMQWSFGGKHKTSFLGLSIGPVLTE